MVSGMGYKKPVSLSCILLSLWTAACLAAPAKKTLFNDVVNKARALAEEPFENTGEAFPEELRTIGYDEWRSLRFKPAKSLWPNEPFSIQFFHPGFIYHNPVNINYVEKNTAVRIPFSPDLFDYSQSGRSDLAPGDIGFAGFRVHYPLNTPTYADEIIAFLGASYFRALGKNMAYGMSARGLAVNTAEPSGEEFPYFREFWVVHPALKAQEITVYALLDSRSLTGAYTFLIRPGEETTVDIKAVLFFRERVHKLGLAPLTSMFFHGENTTSKIEHDFRPEVHDSDGLLIQESSGEWTWHPLVNPETLLINGFGGGQPLGFGLLQRDTDFDHYQDLEARYDNRPSVWVIPGNDWNPGRLELLQIPTANEYNDNIGAYWVVERPFEAGESFEFNYTLLWHTGNQKRSGLASVDSTRLAKKTDDITFVIDFLPGLSQEMIPADDISADIQVLNDYTVSFSQIIKNDITGGWRLVIHVNLEQQQWLLDKVIPNRKPVVELRAFLKNGNTRISETWSYSYLP